MSIYSFILRPLAFNFDPEWVHERAMAMIERGLMGCCSSPLTREPVELFGVKFPNRLGLAAGFDKNALAVDQWHKYGFGFAEIGTVTWHAQPGNPVPRLFRLPEDQALINRMGFNNDGAEVVARRLEKSNPQIPVGINLGKSKVTEPELAHEDYQKSYQVLQSHGDYFVVNVSSPNTPGLRDLQDKDALKRIFGAMRDVNSSQPLFVKIAPDLGDEAVIEVLNVAIEYKLAGIIATNTTISREGLTGHAKGETGGLSGVPVRKRSNEVLQLLRQNAPSEMTLIGVGGVMSREDFEEKLKLGADLVQLYTGWIYGGPASVPMILG